MTAQSLFIHLLLLTVCLTSTCAQLEDDSESEWLDPTNMLQYESGKMKPAKDINIKEEKTKDTADQKKDESRNQRETENLQETFVKEDKVETTFKEKEKSNEIFRDEPLKRDATSTLSSCSPGSKEGAFFRQYVTALLRQFPPDRDGNGVYQVIAALNERDFEALEKFSNSMDGLEEAHDVLIRIIQDVRRTDRPQFTLLERIEKRLGFDLGSIFQLAVIMFLCTLSVILLMRLRFNLTFGRMFFKVFVLMFFVSVPWNWFYLYKLALAKRQAEMLKSVPEECQPQDRSATRSIIAWFRSSFTFNEDECTKYQERMIVDPMWEVPPTQALAVTVTKFFLEPFRHIGVAFSDLVKGLLVGVPVYLWPVVLVLFTLFTLFLITVQAGYKIGFFWNMFGLEPSRQPPQQQIQAAAEQPVQPLPQSERQMIEEQPRHVPSLTPAPLRNVEGNMEGPAVLEEGERVVNDERETTHAQTLTLSDRPDRVNPVAGGGTINPVNQQEELETENLLPLSIPEQTPLQRGNRDDATTSPPHLLNYREFTEHPVVVLNPTIDSLNSIGSSTAESGLQGAGDAGLAEHSNLRGQVGDRIGSSETPASSDNDQGPSIQSITSNNENH